MVMSDVGPVVVTATVCVPGAVLKLLASMFIDENTHDRSASAITTDRFLESQLDDSRNRLISHEKKLEEFRRKYSGELPSQLQSNLQVIQGNQSQIASVGESINRDRDRRLAEADLVAWLSSEQKRQSR